MMNRLRMNQRITDSYRKHHKKSGTVSIMGAKVISPLPASVTILGNSAVTFDYLEKVEDVQSRSATDFYRLPDDSCLIHVHREVGNQDPYIMLHPTPFSDLNF